MSFFSVFLFCLFVSFGGFLVQWLVGWLVDWLAGWLVGWLAGWLVGCSFWGFLFSFFGCHGFG